MSPVRAGGSEAAGEGGGLVHVRTRAFAASGPCSGSLLDLTESSVGEAPAKRLLEQRGRVTVHGAHGIGDGWTGR